MKYSPNLGDGLLSECLEKTLIALGADSDTWSIDLAARQAYGDAMTGRKEILSALDLTPSWLRQRLVRLPLAVKAWKDWRPHYARLLAGANGIVVGGGNLLSDIDLNFPTKLALAAGEAERRSLPFAIYAAGVARHWTPRGLALLRHAFASPLLRGVFVRDLSSKRHWDENFAAQTGCEAAVVRDPGLLAADYIPPSKMYHLDRPVAGIGIMSHIAIRYHAGHAPGRGRLDDWYVDLVTALVGRGFHVVAFTNGSPEDVAYLKVLAGRLAAAGGASISFPVQRTPDELCAIISSLDVLCAHRMHAIIAAYSFGVPFLALMWDPKLNAFVESVHREAFICDAAVTSVETAVDLLCQAGAEGIPAQERMKVLGEARSDVGRVLRLFTEDAVKPFHA